MGITKGIQRVKQDDVVTAIENINFVECKIILFESRDSYMPSPEIISTDFRNVNFEALSKSAKHPREKI